VDAPNKLPPAGADVDAGAPKRLAGAGALVVVAVAGLAPKRLAPAAGVDATAGVPNRLGAPVDAGGAPKRLDPVPVGAGVPNNPPDGAVDVAGACPKSPPVGAAVCPGAAGTLNSPPPVLG
jgi:hypothetical protein